jgi:nucleoid DNA-binding protein
MAGTHDIARDSGMKDTEIKNVFNAILARTKNGERVLIKDFGTFEVKHVKERLIKSPQIPTGEAKVEAHDVIKFRPSPATKVVLNGGEVPPQVADVPKPAKVAAAKPAVAAAAVAAAPKAAAPVAAKPVAAKPAVAAAPKAAAPKPAAPAAAKPAPPAAKKPAPKPAPVAEEDQG